MAQITTEKRTTPAMRSHTTPSAATKENTRHHNASSPSRGKGIEILDFHESWLEEVELYKDKMVMSKDYSSHHNHHNNNPSQSTQQQQSHNNYKSINNNNNNNHRNPRRLHCQSIRSSAGNSSGKSPTKNQNKSTSSSSQSRQKQTTDATAAAVATAAPAKSPPPRITPKLNSVPAPVVGVLQSEPYKKVQVGNPSYICMWHDLSLVDCLFSLLLLSYVPSLRVPPALPC